MKLKAKGAQSGSELIVSSSNEFFKNYLDFFPSPFKVAASFTAL